MPVVFVIMEGPKPVSGSVAPGCCQVPGQLMDDGCHDFKMGKLPLSEVL